MWTAIGSSTQSRVRQNNRKRRQTGVSHTQQQHASFLQAGFGDSRHSVTQSSGRYSPPNTGQTPCEPSRGMSASAGGSYGSTSGQTNHRQMNALGISMRQLPAHHRRIISSASGSGESAPAASLPYAQASSASAQALDAGRASMHRRTASTPAGLGSGSTSSPDNDNQSFVLSTHSGHSLSLEAVAAAAALPAGQFEHSSPGHTTSQGGVGTHAFTFNSLSEPGAAAYPPGTSAPPYMSSPARMGTEWPAGAAPLTEGGGIYYAGGMATPGNPQANAAWEQHMLALQAQQTLGGGQLSGAGGGLLEFDVDPASLKALGMKNLVARRRRRDSDEWAASGGGGGSSDNSSNAPEEVVSTSSSMDSSDSSSSDEEEEWAGPGGGGHKSTKTYFTRRFTKGGDAQGLDNTQPVKLLNGTTIVPSTFGQLLRTSDGVDELALPEVMLARTLSGQLVTVNHRTGQVRLFGESDPSKELSAAEQQRFQEMAGEDDEALPSIFAAFEMKPNGVQSSSQFILELPQRMRNSARALVHNAWFDRVVLSVIMLNCVFLALDEPGVDKESQLAKTLRGADVFFTVFFILEMAIKMVALGVNFSHDYSYFRSAWNCLDFFIVVESIVSLLRVIEIGNFSALRAVRALRPLRTINRLQGLQVLVNSLLHSLPLLCNTLLFIAFYFVVFGIIGLDLWAGVLHQRCYVLATGLPDPDDDRLCGGMHQCSPGSFCGVAEDAPNNDVTSFDNIFLAFVAIFQAITLEGWTQMMYQTQDAFHQWAWSYWMPLVLVGSFILLNLTLAVIMAKFHEAQELQRRNRMQRHAVARARQKALLANRRAKAKEANRYAVKHTRSGVSRVSSSTSARMRSVSKAALAKARFLSGAAGTGGGAPISPFSAASIQHLSGTASINSDSSSQPTSARMGGGVGNPLLSPATPHAGGESKATMPRPAASKVEAGPPKGGLRGGMVPRGRRKSATSDGPHGAATLLGNRGRKAAAPRALPQGAGRGVIAPLPQGSPRTGPAVAAAALGIAPYPSSPPQHLPPYMTAGGSGGGDSKAMGYSPGLSRSATAAPGQMQQAHAAGLLAETPSPQRSATVSARQGAGDGSSFSARADAYRRHQEKALLKARRASMAGFQGSDLDLRRRNSTWGTFAFESATAAAEAKLRSKAETEARRAFKRAEHLTGSGGRRRRASVALGQGQQRESPLGGGQHRRAATSDTLPDMEEEGEGSDGGRHDGQRWGDVPGPFRRMGALDSVRDPHDTVLPALHRGGRIKAGSRHNLHAAAGSTAGSDDEVLGASATDRWEAGRGASGWGGARGGRVQDDSGLDAPGRPRLQRHLSSNKLRRSSTLAMVNIHSGGEEANQAHRGGAGGGRPPLQRSHTMLPGGMSQDALAADGSGRSHAQRAMMTAAAHAAALAAQRRLDAASPMSGDDEVRSVAGSSMTDDDEVGSDGGDSDALEGGQVPGEEPPGPGVLSTLCCCGEEDDTLTGYRDFPQKRPRVGMVQRVGREKNRCQRQCARLAALPAKFAACCGRCVEPTDAEELPPNVRRLRDDPNAPRFFKVHPWEKALQGATDENSRLSCSWCEQTQDYCCPRGTKSQLRFQGFVSAPLEGFITSRLFVLTVGLSIFFNTVALAIEHHNMPKALADTLGVLNIVFTSVFALEMLLKWLGLGFARYFQDKFNIFDSIIVLVSLVELAIDRGSGEGGTFAAFRMARVFRVVRLTRQWGSMKRIVNVVTRSLESFGYLMLLLLLFQFVFALMAMHLMGGIYEALPPSDVPRSNFDTLHNSFISVFQILSGEAWNEIMYEVVGATNQKVYILFFVSWTVIGQFLLLELFLAVLLDAFSGNDMSTTKREQADIQEAASEMVKATMKAKRMRQARSHSVKDKVLFASAIQRRIGTRRRNNHLRKQILFGTAPDLDSVSGAAGGHNMHLIPTGSMQAAPQPPPKSTKAFSALRRFMLKSSSTEKEALAQTVSASETDEPTRRTRPAAAPRGKPVPPPPRKPTPPAPPVQGVAPRPVIGSSNAAAALKRFLLTAPADRKQAIASSMPPPPPPLPAAAAMPALGGLPPVAESTGTSADSTQEAGSGVHRPTDVNRRGSLGLGDLVDHRLGEGGDGHSSRSSSTQSTAGRGGPAAASSARPEAGLALALPGDTGSFVANRMALLQGLSRRKRSSVSLFASGLDDSFLSEARRGEGVDAEYSPPVDILHEQSPLQVFAGASAFLRATRRPSVAARRSDMPLRRPAATSRPQSRLVAEASQAAALVECLDSQLVSRPRGGAASPPKARRRHSAPALSSSQWSRLGDWSADMEAAAQHTGLISNGQHVPSPAAPCPPRSAPAAAAGGAGRRRSSRFGPASRGELGQLRQEHMAAGRAAPAGQVGAAKNEPSAAAVAPLDRDANAVRHARLAGLRGAIRFVQSAKIVRSERVPPLPDSAAPGSPPPRKAMRLKIIRSPLPKTRATAAAAAAAAAASPELGHEPGELATSPAPPTSPVAPPLAQNPLAGGKTEGASSSSPPGGGADREDWRTHIPVATGLPPISEQGSSGRNTTPSSVGVSVESPASSRPSELSPRPAFRRSSSARHTRRVSFARGGTVAPELTPASKIPGAIVLEGGGAPVSPSAIATRAGVMSAALAHDSHGRLRDVHHEARASDLGARQRTANKRAMFAAKAGGVGASDGAMVAARDRKHFEHESDRHLGVTVDASPACSSRHLFLVQPASKLQRCLVRFIDQNTTLFTLRLPPMCGWAGGAQQVTFDGIVLVLIVLSSLLLALEEPGLDRNSGEFQALRIFDIVFTSLFVGEIVLKSAAHGFCLSPRAYVRDKWNLIDLCSVIASLVGLLVASADISFVRVLRLVRCLRPLRLISRNQGMKVVVEALIRSIGAILNVTGVLLLVWFLFGVLGVQLFAGKLAFCNDPDFPPAQPFSGVPGGGGGGWAVQPCNGDFMYFDADAEQLLPREVVTPEANFDNIFNAMLTLFITSSGEGWPTTMYQVSDVTQVNHQPKRGNSKENAYYFVLFIFIGSFFLVNLFIGVVFDEFVATKTDLEGFGFLTERQREWVETQRLLQRAKPISQVKAPRRGIRRTLYSLVNSALFSWLVSACIMLNIVVLAASFWRQPQEYEDALMFTNIAFSVLFALEAILKIVGLGWTKYAQSSWNRFDCLIAAAGLLDSALTNAEGDAVAWVQRVLSIARVLRGVRLFKTFRGLRTIMGTILIALPSLGNVAALLLLIFFIYAVAGMTVFGQVDLQDNLNVHANFKNFALSFGTLFRCATGEGWEGIMFDTMNTDAGGTPAAPIYYITFIVVVTYVMLSLFSLIVVEQYSQQDRQARGLTGEHIKQYRRAWAQVDPFGHKWIPVNKVERLLRLLPRPMGLRKDSTFAEYLEYATRLDVVAWNGKVHFRDLLLALHRVTYGVAIPTSVLTKMETAPDKVQGRIEEKLRVEMENEARRMAAAASRGANHFMTLLARRAAAARQRRSSQAGPVGGRPQAEGLAAPTLSRSVDSDVADIVAGQGSFAGAAASMRAGLSDPAAQPKAAPCSAEDEAAADAARMARLREILGGGGGSKAAPKMFNVVSSAVSQRRMIKAAALGMSHPAQEAHSDSDSAESEETDRTVSGILEAAGGVGARETQAADPRRTSLVEQIGSNPLQVARRRMGMAPGGGGGTIAEEQAADFAGDVSGPGWAVMRPRGAGGSRKLRALSVTRANFQLELTASKIQSAWRERLRVRREKRRAATRRQPRTRDQKGF